LYGAAGKIGRLHLHVHPGNANKAAEHFAARADPFHPEGPLIQHLVSALFAQWQDDYQAPACREIQFPRGA
jgi:hypothetical protein